MTPGPEGHSLVALSLMLLLLPPARENGTTRTLIFQWFHRKSGPSQKQPGGEGIQEGECLRETVLIKFRQCWYFLKKKKNTLGACDLENQKTHFICNSFFIHLKTLLSYTITANLLKKKKSIILTLNTFTYRLFFLHRIRAEEVFLRSTSLHNFKK